jgi:phenylpyruvate tautomerase PptA (4-oxalocrotonate tautomerase family)
MPLVEISIFRGRTDEQVAQLADAIHDVVLKVFAAPPGDRYQGRSREQKQALYAELAATLEQRVGLRPSDLVVSVSENTREDWSFGYGRAQFLEGDLA